MNAAKLAKIKALANDPRGDPATRAIAQRVLDQHAKAPPPPMQDVPRFVDQRHPGVRTSSEYDRHRFFDLNGWKTTNAGNRTFSIVRGGRSFRIVIFPHKNTPTWGWMRIDTISEKTEFSGKFATIAEAHGAAWQSLMTL